MLDEILKQLSVPPNSTVEEMPVVTKYKVLPFEKLLWENFEKFCYCLGSKSMKCIEGSYIYGRRGQKQDGIDLYFNKNGEVNVWQIKRYQVFTSKDIIAAVDTFINGKWAVKVKKFVLCVSNCLDDTGIVDEIDRQIIILGKKGIKFEVYNSEILTNLSLEYPSIVSMFFGKHWVDALDIDNINDNTNSKAFWINSETEKVIDNGEVLEVDNTKVVVNNDVIMGEVEMPDGKKIYAEIDVKTGELLRNPLPYPISEYSIDISEELILECKNEQVIFDEKKYYVETYILKFGGEAQFIYDLTTKKLAFDPFIKAPTGMLVIRNDSDRCFSVVNKKEISF